VPPVVVPPPCCAAIPACAPAACAAAATEASSEVGRKPLCHVLKGVGKLVGKVAGVGRRHNRRGG
jgi:hypothetical protein